MQLDSNPQSMAVTDLQLFIAFYMRNGLDLTNYMTVDANGRYNIRYETEGNFENDKLDIGGTHGCAIVAKFDADGRTMHVSILSTPAKIEINE